MLPGEWEGIKASRHQGIKASRHQGIKASRHQGIKASRHQGIKASRQFYQRGNANERSGLDFRLRGNDGLLYYDNMLLF